MDALSVPSVNTHVGLGDRLGRWRVRWTVGRMRYRVDPGLYRVGNPDPASPVLVTCNYKLTFDVLRAELQGIDAWLLVLDTKGINVWCAAGKETFGTAELVRQVQGTNLGDVVSHRRLIVPQLGATGVSAADVRRLSGFRVVWGPVRARDLGAFLDEGMRATEEMRRVSFTLAERLELVGAELAFILKWLFVLLLVTLVLIGWTSTMEALATVMRGGAPIIAGVLAGTVLVPILLPWIPGRALSLKGAVVGTVVVGAAVALRYDSYALIDGIQLFLIGTAAASFFGMRFTGSTTFTSPSGVEWEMRRALPFQVGAVALAVVLSVAQWVAG